MPSKILPLPPLSQMLETNKWRHFINSPNFFNNQLHGAFDFNRTPLAPPGTKIIIHDKPAIRGSWATRGCECWYIGPALNHYRCHTVYANHTANKRVADTVEFFPHYRKMPYRSSTENSTIAARELTHALQNPSPAPPILECWRQTNGGTSSTRRTFSTSSNKKLRHA